MITANACLRANRLAAMARWLAVLAMGCALGTDAFAVVRYVDIGNAGAENGISWATAYNTIQEGIDAASAGDEVWVAEGTYTGNHGAAGGADNVVILKTNVDLYGGFDGTEVARFQRNWVTNETIIDAQNISGRRGVYGIDDATLDGFTVTRGNVLNGAAMYNQNTANPEVDNCRFVLNVATNDGGAIYIVNSAAPTFTDCVFLTNNAAAHGGAIYHVSSAALTLTRCAFVKNSTNGTGRGGAVLMLSSGPPAFTDCVFASNFTSGADGGAIYRSGGSGGTLSRCSFSDNYSPAQGGGIFLSGAPSLTIEECIFAGGTAGAKGGGIHAGSSSLNIVNSVFLSNASSQDGGGMYAISSNPMTITNSTFTGNSVAGGNHGGGFFVDSSTLTGTNLVLWGNTVTGQGPDAFFSAGTYSLTYSDIGTVSNYSGPTTGNISSNPSFKSGVTSTLTTTPAFSASTGTTVLTDSSKSWKTGEWANGIVRVDNDQYHVIVTNSATTLTVWGDASTNAGGVVLAADPYQITSTRLPRTSPAVNAGTASGAPATDLEGNTRPVGGGIDMGAFENQPPTATIGASATVDVGTPIVLSDNSLDLEGDAITSRTWALTSKPGASSASLSCTNCANPQFTPDVVGTYEITLTVTDGNASDFTSRTFRVTLEEGDLNWARRAGGVGGEERGYAISGAEDGSMFVVGDFETTAIFGPGEANQTSFSPSGTRDCFIAKYEPDGDLIWAKKAGGGTVDQTLGVAALADGGAIVVGWYSSSATFGVPGDPGYVTFGPVGNFAPFIARYASDGSLTWAKTVNNGGGDTVAEGVAALPDGSCIVTGWTGGSTTVTFGSGETNQTSFSVDSSNVFIARYNADGTLAWVETANSGNTDKAWDVAAAADGTSYITGTFAGPLTLGAGEPNQTVLSGDNYGDFFVAKYNANGTLAWARMAGGSTVAPDRGWGVGIDGSDGGVIVGGHFRINCTFDNGGPNQTTLSGVDDVGFIAKWNSNGVFAWAKQIVTPVFDGVYGVVGFPAGGAVVTGFYVSNATFGSGEPNQTTLSNVGGDYDLFVARYEGDGSLAWARKATCPDNEYGQDVSITGLGQIVATGWYGGNSSSSAVFGPGEPNQTTLISSNSNEVFVSSHFSGMPFIDPAVPNVAHVDEGATFLLDLIAYENDLDSVDSADLNWSVSPGSTANIASATVVGGDTLQIVAQNYISDVTETLTLTLTDGDNEISQDIDVNLFEVLPVAPPSSSILEIPAAPVESDDLVAVVAGGSVATNLTLEYIYQWYEGADIVPTRTFGPTTDFADSLRDLDDVDIVAGDQWKCRVYTHDGIRTSAGFGQAVFGTVTGLGASTLTLNVSPPSITLGDSVTLSGSIAPNFGVVPINFDGSSTPPGATSTLPPNINSSGSSTFNFSFVPDEAGAWAFSAAWAGNSSTLGDLDVKPLTVNKSTPTLGVTLSHSSAAVGFEDLVATVSFEAGLPPALVSLKSGKTVEVFLKRPDASSEGPFDAVTNGQGVATIDFAAESFVFDQAGTWQFIAEFDGDSNFNAATSVNFDKPETPRLTIKDGAGYAVLIVGALDDQFAGLGEGQAEHTKTMDFVYRALIDRGLGTDDIYYLRETPAVPLPSGMTLVNDIDDATPTKTEFLAALTVWAKGKMDTAPGPLYVVMIDHGLPDKFYIYSGSLAASSRILTPAELNTSLSTLQNGFTNPAAADQDIVIINGSCNSGSFIEELSGADRTIITSAKGDEKSHRGPLDPVDNKRDGELFVRLLFQNLAGGGNLHDAFAEASARLTEFTLSRANGADPNADLPQEPLLDDNGDGEGSTAAQLSNEFAGAKAEGAESGLDGFDAFAITLGFGANAGDSVGWVTASQTISLAPAQALPQLFARATDQPAIGHSAWIEVKQPSYTSSTAADTGNSQSNNPDEILDNFQQFVNLAVFDSPTVNPADGEYKWQGALVQRGGGQTLTQVLTQAGTYQVYYFVRDGVTGETSSHLITTIYRQSAGNLPPSHVSLTYPGDGEVTLTTTLLAWSPSVDPNGHAITYRVEIAQDAAFTTGLITLGGLSERFVVVGPADGILDGQTYYWRVIPVDQFGAEPAASGAQVRTFETDNDNTTTPGNIVGAVVDALTGLPVPGVDVVVAGPTSKTVGTAGDGVYQATNLTAGAYQVSFSKTGYKGQVVNVPVLAGQVAALNRELEPDSAGFLWGDVSADAKAGVLDAAFIAQWQALMRTTFPIDPAIVKPLFPDGADVNGDNALGTLDISEILKKVVRIIDRFPADTDENGRGPDAKSLEAKALAKATERLLELPANVTGNPGDVILVPITIDDAAGVLGFTFKVDFDAALLEPLGDQSERGEVAAGFETFLVNDASDGSIVVVGAGSTAAEGSGTLVTLAFRVREDAAPTITAALTFDAESSNLNDGATAISLME